MAEPGIIEQGKRLADEHRRLAAWSEADQPIFTSWMDHRAWAKVVDGLVAEVVRLRAEAEETVTTVTEQGGDAAEAAAESPVVADGSAPGAVADLPPSPGPSGADRASGSPPPGLPRAGLPASPPHSPINDRPAPDFAAEQAAYHDRLRYWLRAGFGGQHVAIRGNVIAGLGRDAAEAEALGRERFGADVPFLVQRIEATKGVGAARRNMEGCGG